MARTKEVFIQLNMDDTGVKITMDECQASVFDKEHNIFMNQDTKEVAIEYVLSRRTRYIRSISDGWEFIKVI